MGDVHAILEQALAMMHRRRWLAAAVFAVVFAASVAAVRSLPVIYRSTVLVAIEQQQIPEEYVKNTVTGQIEARLHTMSQELLSEARLEQLVARFSLYPELRNEATTAELTARLRGEIDLALARAQPRVRGTPLPALSISYRGRDPSTVAEVVNALASGYVEENTRLRERQALGTAEFLKSELRVASERLDQQEHKVSAFKRRYLGELPEQAQANLATLERLHSQLRTTTDAQLRAQERIDQRAQNTSLALSLRALAGDQSVPAGESPGARIDRLRHELVELRLRFSDKYPDVIQKQAEIATLERLVEGGDVSAKAGDPSRPDGGNALTGLGAARREDDELKLLKEEEKRVRAAIAEYQQRIENTPKREQEFLELSRDYDSTKQLYAMLLRRVEEAQIAGNLEHRRKGEQFQIIEYAKPASSASPRRWVVTALAFVGALVLAGIAAFIIDQLDASFHSPAEVREFTRVPLLAAIPEIVSERDVTRRRLGLALGAVVTAAAVVLVSSVAHYVAKENELVVLTLMRLGI